MSYQLAPRIALKVKHMYGPSGSLVNGASVDWLSSADLVGSPASTLDTSNGQITIPNTPCIALAGLCYGVAPADYGASYADYQWYDVNAAQFVGSIGRLWGDRSSLYYASNTLSCDEEAKAIVQNTIIELRIVAISSTGTLTYDGVGSSSAHAFSTSRAIIEEYS